jgi:hypothetical protein
MAGPVTVARTARAVAHLVAQVTSREACATSRELMRLPYSRCSIERVGHAVGAALTEARREAQQPGPKIMRNYRMAYCATATLHDEQGDALHTIRYGRMPPEPDSIESITHRDVHRMLRRMLDDVVVLRRRAGPLPVVLLADGAPELWRLFSQHFNSETLGVAPIKLIDAWHALEYIAAAARLLESREKVLPGAFRRWKAWLML